MTRGRWIWGVLAAWLALPAGAVEYRIDTQGAHAFIEFRIQHLGFSWMFGRFDRFKGGFEYDEQHPERNRVEVVIEMDSVNTNHTERDRHLRGPDFFDVKRYPLATFVGDRWTELGDGRARLSGRLQMRGITRPVTLTVTHMGHGRDPWGGYRRGFYATGTLKLSDWKMKKAAALGSHAEEIRLELSLEGIRQ